MPCRRKKQFWRVRDDFPGDSSADLSAGKGVGRRCQGTISLVSSLRASPEQGVLPTAEDGAVLPANPLRGCNRVDPVDIGELIAPASGYEH